MPDHAPLDTFGEFLAQGKRGEKLLIAHDVLFEFFHLRAVCKFHRLLHVGERITQQEQETPP